MNSWEDAESGGYTSSLHRTSSLLVARHLVYTRSSINPGRLFVAKNYKCRHVMYMCRLTTVHILTRNQDLDDSPTVYPLATPDRPSSMASPTLDSSYWTSMSLPNPLHERC